MKKGLVIKSADTSVSSKDLELINKYTRRELSNDEVYVFSVVLCDNDIDRDFERFTVESLFELEKLFVGKSGVFDHDASARNQTARVFECKVEAVDGKKTATGDDYFRLVCRAYMPYCDKNRDIITAIDSGILKEVSVGCAVKHTLCSVCGNDMYLAKCHHTKGATYHEKLCHGVLSDVIDAYEFSFVAVPCQKEAGVIKAFSKNKEEIVNMKELLSTLKKGKEVLLKDKQTQKLCDYIDELKKQALDGEFYKEQLKNEVCKCMGVITPQLNIDTIKSIVSKMSVYEMKQVLDEHEKSLSEQMCVQLTSRKNADNKNAHSNQFTI